MRRLVLKQIYYFLQSVPTRTTTTTTTTTFKLIERDARVEKTCFLTGWESETVEEVVAADKPSGRPPGNHIEI